MGQDISKAFTPPPLSFCDCFVDGRINLAKYIVYSTTTFDDDYIDIEQQLNRNKRNYNNQNTSSKKKVCVRSVKSIQSYAELRTVVYWKPHIKIQLSGGCTSKHLL